MERTTVLLCDDNITVHQTLSLYFREADIDVISVYDGESALAEFQRHKVDCIVLDVMLPKMFGTKVCEEIRKASDVPIILISARGEAADRISGLQIGADDYITKPFSPREVVVRVQTILRRVSGNMTQGGDPVIRYEELVLDPKAYTCTLAGQPLELTSREIEILRYLIQNTGIALKREQILNAIWGYDYFGDLRVVDTRISRLRRKLNTAGASFDIVTVYGVGYRLEKSKDLS